MSYSINPESFKSIFAVPTDIVDKHIRLANEHQLKVLLWILRNSPDKPDMDKMCKALKMNKDDALDYMQYWVLTGVVKENAEDVTDNGTPAYTPAAEPVRTVIRIPENQSEDELAPSRPSSTEIAARIEESPEIGHLFNEAQIKLGKTIGYNGQCTLLLLHDHYGLPADVLFMLIDYCVSVGKSNYGYIEAVGKDWGEREIDTLSKAAEQIASLNNSNSLWKGLASYAGLNNPRPTPKQTSYIRRWSEEWQFSIDMICLAYDEMATNTGKLSFTYMDKVLLNWRNSGYKTPAEVEAASEARAQKSADTEKKIPAGNSNKASYDLDEFKNQSLHGTLKYERKKKQ